MAKYHVLLNVMYKRQLIQAGCEADFDEKTAAELLAAGVISGEAPAPKQEAAPAPVVDTSAQPAELRGGGDDSATGEPTLDGDASDVDGDAKEVGPLAPKPEVNKNMSRDDLNAIALAEGASQAMLDACGTKAEVVSLIEANRAPKQEAAPTETENDPSAGL